MEMVKEQVKAWLGPYDGAFRFASATYNSLRFSPIVLRRILRDAIRQRGGRPFTPLRQRPLLWRVPLPAVADADALMALLRRWGIEFFSGLHAIYLPPQEKLAELFPAVVSSYPKQTGFKILRDMRPVEEAQYLYGDKNIPIRRWLVGPPQEQVVAANLLFGLGIGPRVWDVSTWQGEANALTVFAVDHVAGVRPSKAQWQEFIAALEEAEANGEIEVALPSWRTASDFECPDCRGNLIFCPDSRRLMYVDFQSFAVPDHGEYIGRITERHKDVLHFGKPRPFRGSSYLYQSLPGTSTGKRDTDERWRHLTVELGKVGVAFDERLVLDVGCNAGLMLFSALATGAKWGLGWDLPEVAAAAEKLLLALGASRFSITPAVLQRDYDLAADIPTHLAGDVRESVVLYLSVSRNLGLLPAVARIPWRALVYEGHQGDDLEASVSSLLIWAGPGVRVAAEGRRADGESDRRPFVILMRE